MTLDVPTLCLVLLLCFSLVLQQVLRPKRVAALPWWWSLTQFLVAVHWWFIVCIFSLFEFPFFLLSCLFHLPVWWLHLGILI